MLRAAGCADARENLVMRTTLGSPRAHTARSMWMVWGVIVVSEKSNYRYLGGDMEVMPSGIRAVPGYHREEGRTRCERARILDAIPECRYTCGCASVMHAKTTLAYAGGSSTSDGRDASSTRSGLLRWARYERPHNADHKAMSARCASFLRRHNLR